MTEARLSQSTGHELALLTQRIAAQQDPAAILAEGERYLGALYHEAQTSGDDNAMALVTTAWGNMQALATHAAHMSEIADGVLAVANAVAAERDKVLSEHVGLVEAVSSIDREHPLVDDLVEAVAEDVESYMAEYYDEAVDMGMRDALEGLGIDARSVDTWQTMSGGDVPAAADIAHLIDQLMLFQAAVLAGEYGEVSHD
jgi:hypothetical protein